MKKADPTKIIFYDKLNEKKLKTTKAEFLNKVSDVGRRLGVPMNWLLFAMELESAGTFDPSITNSLGYTGLIQFGAVAAKEVGTTTTALRRMDAVTQMEYVYKYLVKYKSKYKTFVDLYLAIFFPLAIGKPEDWVLEAKGLPSGKVAQWNPLFDLNKDGKIQVKEIRQKLLNRVPEEFKKYFV